MQSMLPAGLGTQPVPPTALEPDGRTMARAMGALLALGGICVLLWLALPHPPGAQAWPILGLTIGDLVIAGALLAGAGDRLPTAAFVGLAALAAVAISVGVYYSGQPGGGFPFLYLWVAPYAF